VDSGLNGNGTSLRVRELGRCIFGTNHAVFLILINTKVTGLSCRGRL